MAGTELDPLNTPIGLMERLFLHETRTPLFPSYKREDSLKAMRLMRQALRNRLKHPREWGAAGATSIVDIITIRSQFGAFADYPDLPARFMRDPYMIVHLANAPNDPRSAKCAEHVKDAITAATEQSPPAGASVADVVAWRTENHGSPGPRFRMAITLQGNTFFTVPGGR